MNMNINPNINPNFPNNPNPVGNAQNKDAKNLITIGDKKYTINVEKKHPNGCLGKKTTNVTLIPIE
ncbi:MAG: hypothetical protein LBI77_01870, partial [Puniceicoccales bacterium]|nr:hypothetical protein [Puniceicoccales bacterium]